MILGLTIIILFVDFPYYCIYIIKIHNLNKMILTISSVNLNSKSGSVKLREIYDLNQKNFLKVSIEHIRKR
jgi:hypothetical protein